MLSHIHFLSISLFWWKYYFVLLKKGGDSSVLI